MSKDSIRNNHYYDSLLELLNIKQHKYTYTTITMTAFFIITGYKIIYDTVINMIESKYYLVRDLFIYNYLASLFYILITLYITSFFTRKTRLWFKNEFKDQPYKIIHFEMSKDVLYNPYVLVVFVCIFFIRFLITLEYYPWDIRRNLYLKWYYGMELVVIISTLVLFYTLIVCSYLLYKYTNENTLKIIDTGDYRKNYKPVYDLSQKIIYVALASICVEGIGLTYWIYRSYNELVLMATVFFAIVIIISFTSIFWVMYRGISSSLEKTKSGKINEIRNQDSDNDIKDIRISFHNEISYWQVGPKILDSVILPIFVGEMIVILQYVAIQFLTAFQSI